MFSHSCLITAAIIAAPLVVAQSLQDLQSLPQCAQTPAESAFAATGCGLNEPDCVCKNAGFQTSLTNDVMKDCSPTDQVAVLKFSTNFCAKAGITVNVPQTTEAAAQSLLNPTPAAAASSSALPPPPPPPPSSSSAPPPPSPPPSSSSAAPSTSSSLLPSSTSLSSTLVSGTPSSSLTSASFFIAPAFSAVMTSPYTLRTSASYPLSSSSILAYNGSNSTLYSSNILSFTGGAPTSSVTLARSLLIAGSVLGLLIW